MRLIGVIDVMNGRAVHARGGTREHYRPVRSLAGRPIREGDAGALARVYLDLFELDGLYVADLDAIMRGTPHDRIVSEVAALGAPLWVDAGVSSVNRARDLLACGAARVIVGLETLTAYDALERICAAVGGERVVFSLDMSDGMPVAAAGAIPPGETPEAVVAHAARAGAGAVVVLDLSKVGTAMGPAVDLVTRVRADAEGLMLLAGGGVRNVDDLRLLAAAGCDGALIASALHDGTLDAAGVATIRHVSPVR
jgi:phosphoribosylformimino-5-aminoimidazole carboxamide ribotide isomerase